MTLGAAQPARRAATGIATVALAMGLVAFVLGPAAFAPALLLAVVALPLAVAAFVFHAKRMAAMAFYWSAAALLTSPIVRLARAEVDAVIVILGVTGLALSVAVYGNHRRSQRATRQ